MNRHLYFRTTPCYHGMILNVSLSVPLLNNAQNFNFFVLVQGWGISVANLFSPQKAHLGRKNLQPKLPSLTSVFMKYSIWKNYLMKF